MKATSIRAEELAKEVKELEIIAEWSAELRNAAWNLLDNIDPGVSYSAKMREAIDKLNSVLDEMEER